MFLILIITLFRRMLIFGNSFVSLSPTFWCLKLLQNELKIIFKNVSICVCGILGSMKERMWFDISGKHMKIKAGVQYFWQQQVLSVSGTESVGKWMRPLGMSTPWRPWGACKEPRGRPGRGSGYKWGKLQRLAKNLQREILPRMSYSLLLEFYCRLKKNLMLERKNKRLMFHLEQ